MVERIARVGVPVYVGGAVFRVFAVDYLRRPLSESM